MTLVKMILMALSLIQGANALIVSHNVKRIYRTSLRTQVQFKSNPSKHDHRGNICMKDLSSSYWFKLNDKVRVTSSVMKAGVDLKGRVGIVTQTWEKCDVDPTCCCAEFVDENYAVQVKFQGPVDPENPSSDDLIQGIDMFVHYFNENELTKEVDSAAESSSIDFDGMSCAAFKLDQLKVGQQAQRIASFEASKKKHF